MMQDTATILPDARPGKYLVGLYHRTPLQNLHIQLDGRGFPASSRLPERRDGLMHREVQIEDSNKQTIRGS